MMNRNYDFSKHSLVYIYNKLYNGADHYELTIKGQNDWLKKINASKRLKNKFWNDFESGNFDEEKYKKYGYILFWAEFNKHKKDNIDVLIISNMTFKECENILLNDYPKYVINNLT